MKKYLENYISISTHQYSNFKITRYCHKTNTDKAIKHIVDLDEQSEKLVYYEGTLISRNDGPATLYFNNFGRLYREDYLVNGGYHNHAGPAINHIDYPSANHYFVCGKDITFKVRKWIKEKGYSIPFTDQQAYEFQMKFS